MEPAFPVIVLFTGRMPESTTSITASRVHVDRRHNALDRAVIRVRQVALVEGQSALEPHAREPDDSARGCPPGPRRRCRRPSGRCHARHGLPPARIGANRGVRHDELVDEHGGLRSLLAGEGDQLLGPEVDDRLEEPVGRAVVHVGERLTPEGVAGHPALDLGLRRLLERHDREERASGELLGDASITRNAVRISWVLRGSSGCGATRGSLSARLPRGRAVKQQHSGQSDSRDSESDERCSARRASRSSERTPCEGPSQGAVSGG